MKIPIFLLWLLFTGTASAQQPVAVRTDSEVLDADTFVGYDNFGFCYFTKDDVLSKKNGAAILEYKNLSLGKISKVDIRNPLQIVVFYENFNAVVLLDNQLNETRKVNFSGHAVPIVASAVGMASGNRLWLFNTLSQKIGLFDYLKNDFREITIPLTGKIAHYETDFNQFHWIDDRGIHRSCDVYGKITVFGQTVGIDWFTIADPAWMLFAKDEKLYAHTTTNNKTYALAIDEKTFKSFQYQAQILSIFTAQGITNYKLTLP